jgi:hypothetical protein
MEAVPEPLKSSFETVVFNCSSESRRRGLLGDQGTYGEYRADAENMKYLVWQGPKIDLVLTVNFTGLLSWQWRGPMLPRPVPDSLPLRVYLSLTSNIKNALMSTRPTLLGAGSHLVAEARITLRQRLKSSVLSTFGLYVSVPLLVS